MRAQEQNLEPVDPRLEKMADNALLDMEYQTMIKYILEETPLHELDRSGELFKLSSERQYLGVWTFSNGSRLVVKNSSEVVVPKGDRQEVLDELHATHMGVEGMKKLARGKMTWKNMTKDIEAKYAECEACLVHSRSKPNIPNHRRKVVPTNLELAAPGEKLAADFGEYGSLA